MAVHFSWYPSDFTAATVALDLTEVGVYMRLINYYYTSERALPSDKRILRRITGATTKDEFDALDRVLAQFFYLQDGVWRHDRVDKEISKAQEKYVTAVANGKRGAKKRWGGQ